MNIFLCLLHSFFNKLQAIKLMTNEISQLKWRCRRGMKELDLCLQAYLEHAYLHAAIEEQQTFKHLLALPDDELYALLILDNLSPNPLIQAIIHKIQRALS